VTFIGYHASHEQHPPSELLAAVRAAPEAGFDGAMCSDHLAPWSVAQGHSGHAWAWLGAALEATPPAFTIGLVTSPGGRYHPAVLAQALATLEELHPGRCWAALGSGEALNEHVTGEPWPAKPERDARLRRNVDILRALLAGATVDDEAAGVHEARIWSRPTSPPPLYAAAVSPDTAADAADWADGLVTVGVDPAALGETADAYERAGGTGPRCVQLHLSLAATEAEAVQLAVARWPNGAVPPPLTWDLAQPEDFDRVAAEQDPEAIREGVLVASEVGELAARIAAIAAAGYDRLYLHHVGADQLGFLDLARAELLPAIRELTPLPRSSSEPNLFAGP